MTTDEPWFVYLVECCDGSYYTGVARDVEARVERHNAGTGARYTRSRRPVRVVASSGALAKSDAHRFEHAVKGLPRDTKPSAVASLAGAPARRRGASR